MVARPSQVSYVYNQKPESVYITLLSHNNMNRGGKTLASVLRVHPDTGTCTLLSHNFIYHRPTYYDAGMGENTREYNNHCGTFC